jgi:serine/threonine protein kinase
MGGNHSRRVLRKKLKGGAYVGNGSFKCVVDASDDLPCRDRLGMVLEPANFVKILLPKDEYEAEKDIKEDMYEIFTPKVASSMFLFMSDSFCNYKEHQFPDLKVGDKVLKFCNTKNEDTYLQLVVTYCERGQSFASYGENNQVDVAKFDFVWFMDVAHALYKLSLNKYMHADAKPLNMVVSRNMGKLIDFGFLRSYEHLDMFDYYELERKKHYEYWPLVFANLVRDKVDTPKITSQEARTEVFESVDKHGLAVCLLFDCYNWPKRTPDWLLFKDLDAPLRLYTCDTVKPTSQNTRFDPFYDTPFYSWPRILANLRQFFKTNLGVDAPALDDNYLSARQATIESKSLELGVGASTSNSQEMRDVLMPLQEPKLGDELSAPSNSTRKRKLGDQRGEPATKQPAI